MVSPPLPRLEDYSISPKTGFVPDISPLVALGDPYYAPWETTISNLQPLILSKKIRQVVDRLPTLSTDRLQNEQEWRRAYVILSFLSHSYVWGDSTPSETLPSTISIPYLAVSLRLEVPPVATYAALCLWNFKPIFPEDSIESPENLATLHTFTGALDESWFYIVSVAIETRGASILRVMLDAIQAVRDDNVDTVISGLQFFAERLGELTHILGKMYENCDPHIFYSRIRPYLAGSKNMVEAGLPQGVRYLDGSGTEPFRQYSGGSNAQSSLIQAFDILLGVEHRPTGDRRLGSPSQDLEPHAKSRTHNFILEMREYMPGPHRRFLEHLARVSNIQNYVRERPSVGALTVAYDACLHMLRSFRDKHIQIVSRYIVLPAKEQRLGTIDRAVIQSTAKNPKSPVASSTTTSHLYNYQAQPKGLAKLSSNRSDLRGTGGTALIPFLKQARDETGDPSIGVWARRLLTSSRISFPGRETESIKIQGLAGQWLDSEDVGGICHW